MTQPKAVGKEIQLLRYYHLCSSTSTRRLIGFYFFLLVTEKQMCWITALFCFQDDLHETQNSASATDELSATSFIEYPKNKPFINSDLLRSPQKPVIPYPESNSRGNSSAKLYSYLFPNHVVKHCMSTSTKVAVFLSFCYFPVMCRSPAL